MYAGPEPLIAVTASWCFSGTRSTLPHERSSCSASARCASSQWLPALMAAMPWSTRAGVLGMTRTTGVPSGSRSCRYDVVIPAARLTTRLPRVRWSRISSSSPPMSCGLTTSTRVSAAAAASALDMLRTPYLARSSDARSSRRSVTMMSPASRPARTSPDSRVSPLTPAPKIATVPMPSSLVRRPAAGARVRPGRRLPASALGGQASQEEHRVGGAFRHPAHEVAVPLLAVGDVDAHLVAPVGNPALLLRADAVEHLVLEGVGGTAVLGGERAGDLDQARVVAGDHRVALAGHEHLQAADVRLVDVLLGLEGDRLGLLVGALAQADPAAGGGEVAAVGLGAVQV